MNDEIKERLEEIECKLIEQEHRPLQVISNYLRRKKKWPEGDDRRDAAAKALIWRLFFSPGTLAASGGIIAIVSLVLLAYQNGLIGRQNSLINEQNQFFQEQILRGRISSSSEIVFAPEASYSPARKAVALIDLVSSLKILQPHGEINLSGAILPGCDFTGQDLSNLLFRDADLRGTTFKGANLNSTRFINCNMSLYDSDGWSSSIRTHYTDFTHADLTEASILSCNLFHSDFSFTKCDSLFVSDVDLSNGESTGISVGGTLNVLPMPILLSPDSIPEETLRRFQVDYGAITDSTQLRDFIETIEDMQTYPVTSPFFQAFSRRNAEFYRGRLKENRMRFKSP